ncbi:MAG: AAA family ATPase [Anaerolineae bacterium]
MFGSPRVEGGGAVLSVPRRQVRALLYRLAAELEPIPREHLCFLFWADAPEPEARRQLTNLLTHLRRELHAPDLLLSFGDRVGLDPCRVSSDVVAFRHLASSDGEIEALRQAVDLYRGPFLAGFSLPGSPEFEVWALEQKGDCERLFLEVLLGLIEGHTGRQEHDTAIAYARRYLDTDELAEDVHRRLIGLYAATGNRSAALTQFERCAAILERELGVRPLPETRAVYESALRSRQPSTARAARDISWTTMPSLDVPLVGRDKACRELSEALSHVQAGHGHVMLISGESGIGKSCLMEAFATRVGDSAVVLGAAARFGEHPLPYQPVAEALRSLPDIHALTTDVHPVWLAEATRLLPELRDLHSDLPPPLPGEPEEARTRLLEALCRLVLGLAEGAVPLLLCLDDLHWADSATFDWLVCLARRLADQVEPRRPLLILGTYLSGEAGRVNDLRHSLLRLGVLSELRLEGLEPGSVLQIIHHLVGPRRGSEALAQRLHRATGGNPFFLLETLRVLLEAGQMAGDLDGLEEVPLPDTVRQAVEARLGRLDPGARQVLEAGAVLGVSFGFEVVRLTAGRGEMETVDGLDRAVAHQLLAELPSGYRFQHALIRQTVEAALGPVRRHLLHRRAAWALERIDPLAAGVIARHYDLGGEQERALRTYRRAAEQAAELFAWQEAEMIQSRMLALIEGLDPDRSEPEYVGLHAQVLADRAHVRFLEGRLEDRDADLADLVSLADESGDRNVRLQALVHRVRYLNLDAMYEDALGVAEEGLVLANSLDRQETRCRLLAQIGFAHYFLGQPRQALTALESALAASGEDGSLAMHGRIAHILGYVYFHLGEYSRSLRWQQEAYACHRAVGDQNRVAWDGLDIGAVHLELGDYDAAETCLGEHLSLARRIGAQPAEAYGLTLLGTWELRRGGYAAAAERFEEAGAMQHHLRSEHGVVATALGAGLALWHLGEPERSHRALQQAMRRARAIRFRRRLAESLVAVAMVEMETGSREAAYGSLMEAVAVARDSECLECVAAGLSALARLGRRQGNLSGAVDHAREGVAVAQGREMRVFEGWARMELGLALLAEGKLREALEQTSRALTRVPYSHEAWIGSEELHDAHARVLEAAGQVEEARQQRQLAEEVVQAKARRIFDQAARERYVRWARRKL